MNLANSTMCPIVDFGQRSWTFVRLLFFFIVQVDNAFWSQICASFAQYWNLFCLNEATSCSCGESVLVESNSGNDFHPQEHPIFGKIRRLYCFQSFDY